MAFGYDNIINGLRLVPKASTSNSLLGDMEASSAVNKVYLHNGTTNSPLVTEDHSATLTNKTISGASNTLSNIGDGSLSVSYIKADGTRALTGNWGAGAFSITANSVILGNAANQISGLSTIINGSGTLTLPSTTDTLVGRDTSDALTNKTISGSNNTLSNIGDGSLSVSYVKADGTRQLTGNWSAGAYTITANSVQLGSAANTITGLSTIINTGTLTLPTATDTLVGRATSDTLSNKTFSDAITLTQISTPSNPTAGKNKVYPKTDGFLYLLDSSGNETPVGSGGYLVLSTATIAGGGTITLGTGKSQYIPVAGSGGAITLSTTPFASAPLDGTVITLEGTNDTNTVSITMTDSAGGCVGNGNIELAKYNTITFVYRSSINRYVEVSRS